MHTHTHIHTHTHTHTSITVDNESTTVSRTQQSTDNQKNTPKPFCDKRHGRYYSVENTDYAENENHENSKTKGVLQYLRNKTNKVNRNKKLHTVKKQSTLVTDEGF